MLYDSQNTKILAAIAFDDQSDAVVKSALALCTLLKKDLYLVHICQLEKGISYLTPYFAHAEQVQLNDYVAKSQKELATRRMDEFCSSIKSNVAITTDVAVGDAARLINEKAQIVGASIIVVGAGKVRQRFLPPHWSVASDLFTETKRPILCVDQKHPVKTTEGQKSLVVFDDLSSESKGAVDQALLLAVAMGKVDLHHWHITGLTKENLKSGLDAAMAVSRESAELQVSSAEIVSSIDAHLTKKMDSRVSFCRKEFEDHNCRYFPKIWHGHESFDFATAVGKVDPMFTVFGCHKTFRRKPFRIGRFPVSSMLSSHYPTIITPATH